MRVKEESEKAGLKVNVQKTKIMASDPITSWQIDGGKVEIVTDFIFLGSKITVDGDCSHEIKRHLLLGRKSMTNLDSVLKGRDIILPRSRWGASVHHRWRNLKGGQSRISFYPTTGIPDLGLELPDFQPPSHRPLHSSLLSMNTQASLPTPSASQHTPEMDQVGLIPCQSSEGQGCLPT